MTEKQLQQLIIGACRWAGLLVYHTFDSRRSEPGFPDLVIAGSRVLYRELKTARGKVTTEQRRWLDELTTAGADTKVWRPSDWPHRVLDDLAAIGGHIRRDAAS